MLGLDDRPREFTRADKQACRAFNVAALNDSLHIADPGECLWLDWVELAGENNPTCSLLAPMLRPHAGRFLGVDVDRGCIARNKARELPHTLWHCGGLQALLADQPDIFEATGVLNYDSFAGWHADSIIRETAPIVVFAAAQQWRVGEFVLIVNAAMTRNVPRPEALARAQRVFAPLLAPLGRKVESDDLFWYRAQGDKNDMLNVRVKLGFR